MYKESFRSMIEKIKSRADIISVVKKRIELDRNNKALCPFHSEKTPSFSVNPRGQYFHCFGCGEGGDVIKFIQLFENKTFREAVKALSKEANIKI